MWRVRAEVGNWGDSGPVYTAYVDDLSVGTVPGTRRYRSVWHSIRNHGGNRRAKARPALTATVIASLRILQGSIVPGSNSPDVTTAKAASHNAIGTPGARPLVPVSRENCRELWANKMVSSSPGNWAALTD